MTDAAVIEADGVVKRFGDVEAVRGVSFRAGRGEVVAVLGPNGAGKTTLLRILLGLRRPDAGRATLFGGDPRRPGSRQRLGTTPQETDLPETLRVKEVVDFVRAHFACPLSRDDVLDRFALGDLAHRQTGGLSGGQRRRLAIALAFAGDPQLVVLDEPSAGLDADVRRRLWESVRTFAERDRTILLTTHDLAEAEALASRVLLLRDGQLVRDASVRELVAAAGLTQIRLRRQPLPPVAGVEHVVENGRYVRLLCRDAGDVVRDLVAQRVDLSEIEVTGVSLEQALAAEADS